MKITLITAAQVQSINKMICEQSNSKHLVYDLNKIESALHSAFYPGTFLFYHGGIAKVAGALAFYILKAHAFFDGNKRTALLSSTAFLRLNGLILRYPGPADGWSEFAVVLDKAAANDLSIDQLKDWYETHKLPLTD